VKATGEVEGQEIRNEQPPDIDRDRDMEARASKSNQDHRKVTGSPKILVLSDNKTSVGAL